LLHSLFNLIGKKMKKTFLLTVLLVVTASTMVLAQSTSRVAVVFITYSQSWAELYSDPPLQSRSRTGLTTTVYVMAPDQATAERLARERVRESSPSGRTNYISTSRFIRWGTDEDQRIYNEQQREEAQRQCEEAQRAEQRQREAAQRAEQQRQTEQAKADAITLRNSGLAALENGNWQRAITDYSRAIQLDPTTDAVNVYRNRGFAYNQTADYNRAVADFTRAIELSLTLTIQTLLITGVLHTTN
jgi:tetratricopeptide (TPR) repeat protein